MSDIFWSTINGNEAFSEGRAMSDMPRVMLALGEFNFSIDTAAYSALSREMEWRWAEQNRAGKQDLLQYTGKAGRTVTLEGEALSQMPTGDPMAALDELVSLSDKAEPQLLVSSTGDIMGWWVIKRYSDNANNFVPGGGARHKTFTLTIQHYADDLLNP
jgi:phage protein U